MAGLIAKRAELVKLRDRLGADIRAIVVDIDHLEAAIRIFDPENTPEARKRYAAMHRAPKGQSMRFVLASLRTADRPLTSRELALAWCRDRSLDAKDSTVVTITKRIGATLRALMDKGVVAQDGHLGGLVGWRLITSKSTSSWRTCQPEPTCAC